MVKNDKDQLISTRIQSGWRECIDYTKLNSAIKKDYFPLLFLDQMLERLARQAFYCFVNRCSDYNQVFIAPKDQEKTTFTFPIGTYAFRKMPFELCNAPATFQRSMTFIFFNLFEKCLEISVDDFTIYGDSFKYSLTNLEKFYEGVRISI